MTTLATTYKARSAAIPASRLREYERDDWHVSAKIARRKFDRAADSFELSEREYLKLAFCKEGYPDLFEGELLARLFLFDDARKPTIDVNYWRKWERKKASHIGRALAAFERAEADYIASVRSAYSVECVG